MIDARICECAKVLPEAMTRLVALRHLLSCILRCSSDNLDNPVADYILRGVDPAVWKRVKARAALEGLSVRQVILALLKQYAGPPRIGGTRQS
jgi:hypothetical protein